MNFNRKILVLVGLALAGANFVVAAEKESQESAAPLAAAATTPATTAPATAGTAAPAASAAQTEPKKLTREEFIKIRDYAVKDTGRKAKVLSEAKTCFAASKDQEAFTVCNNKLQSAIRAHMAEQLAEANKQ